MSVEIILNLRYYQASLLKLDSICKKLKYSFKVKLEQSS